MKTRILLIAALFLSLPLSVYESYASPKTMPATADVGDTILRFHQSEIYDGVCVDINTPEDGFYSLLSDIEIHFDENSIEYLSITNPMLLGFQVSSAHNGGVWLMDLAEGQNALNELSDVAASLRNSKENDLAERIENVIDILSRSGPYTQAST
ncbi:MAG: hypothetical protein ACI4DT_05670 [Chordicoccus sp.]